MPFNAYLTMRERQAIVAALLAWQNAQGFHSMDELREHYDLAEDPLENDEVDELIWRLMGYGL